MVKHSVLSLCLLLSSGTLQAHKLNVFAFTEENRIVGEVYFAGGTKARGALIELQTTQGQTLAQTQSDAQGSFEFTVDSRQDYRVLANTGDGHAARWQLSSEELIGDWDEENGSTVLPAKVPEPTPDTTAVMQQADGAPLHIMIERAVARQVNPLREQLIRAEDRLRLRDILGGLGYIAGLAGLALWWQSRRSGAKR